MRLSSPLADNFRTFSRQPNRENPNVPICMAEQAERKGSIMTSHKDALASKLQALTVLLDDPRADDDEWAVDLLYALEAIYDIALHPDAPITAASRTSHALAA